MRAVRFSAWSSLRAKRSNPASDWATGLLRHFAPRNDDPLRAFAPSREPNLLFDSREGAKTRRRITSIAFLALAIMALPANACMVKLPTLSDREIESQSDVIVKGWLRLSHKLHKGTSVTYVTGSINTTYLVKGRRSKTYQISHEFMDLACQGWGWNPIGAKDGSRILGKFFLFENGKGTYSIAKFTRYPKL